MTLQYTLVIPRPLLIFKCRLHSSYPTPFSFFASSPASYTLPSSFFFYDPPPLSTSLPPRCNNSRGRVEGKERGFSTGISCLTYQELRVLLTRNYVSYLPGSMCLFSVHLTRIYVSIFDMFGPARALQKNIQKHWVFDTFWTVNKKPCQLRGRSSKKHKDTWRYTWTTHVLHKSSTNAWEVFAIWEKPCKNIEFLILFVKCLKNQNLAFCMRGLHFFGRHPE